jgi:hypothetical protein
MRESLLGGDSQWDVVQQAKYSKRLTTTPWTNTCRPITHHVDNLDLPLLLEMLLSELSEEIRKLPLKVVDYIRQDTPFAILIPLSLLNEIERVGKNEVDNHIREKRSRMKLIISSSLGQAWLINHPSCRLETSTHSVFFTEITDNETLQSATNAMFSSWYIENVELTDATFSSKDMSSQDIDLLVVDAIDRLMTGGISHEHDAFANVRPRGLRAKRRDNYRQVITNQSTGQDDSTTTFPDQSENEEESKSNSNSSSEEVSTECQRTLNHPLHTISTALPLHPIERWATLQDLEDISHLP